MPYPFKILDIFGGKSIYLVPRIFGIKRGSSLVINWLNFIVDISNSFLEFFSFQAPLTRNKIGAALGRVPGVPVNPWISRTAAAEPVDF